MPSLHNKTIFITGASRGIGKAIGMRAARDGANVVVTGKTIAPHPKLPGTIYSAAEDIERAGGRALAVAMDVRDEAQVDAAIAQAVERFGGIDALVNNASAIALTGTLATPIKRFDLMHQVNTRGTFLCTQKAVPHLRRAVNPHVLNLAPPLESTLSARWFAPHGAYTMAKYGMSLCVLGMAEEFRADGIAVNALWPQDRDRHRGDQPDYRRRGATDADAARRDRRRRRLHHPHASESRVHGTISDRR